jgi:hypothetical protein
MPQSSDFPNDPDTFLYRATHCRMLDEEKRPKQQHGAGEPPESWAGDPGDRHRF